MTWAPWQAWRSASKRERFWHVVVYTDFALIATMLTVQLLSVTIGDTAPATPGDVLTSTLVIVLLFFVIPLCWLYNTKANQSWRAALEYAGVRRPQRSDVRPALVALAILLVGWLALSFVAQALGADGEASGDAVSRLGFWAFLVGVILVAASEEFLFRGLLQRWVGLHGQAVLFALTHATFREPIVIALALVAGYVLGLVAKRTGGIVAAVAAHVAYNVTQFAYAQL